MACIFYDKPCVFFARRTAAKICRVTGVFRAGFCHAFSSFFTGERSAVRIVPHGNIHIIYMGYFVICKGHTNGQDCRCMAHGGFLVQKGGLFCHDY